MQISGTGHWFLEGWIGDHSVGFVVDAAAQMELALKYRDTLATWYRLCGGASLQLHRWDSALSGRVFTVGHSSIPPYSEAGLHCYVRTTGGRALPSSGLLEGLTLFAENTGLIVGITLVDPSKWKISAKRLSWWPHSRRWE